MTTSPPAGLDARFWKLWTANSLANLSDGIQVAALPLLTVAITQDPVLVSGVTVAAQLPWLLFSPFSGVMVDRMNRRTAMAGALALKLVLMAALALLVFLDTPAAALLAAIYVGAFLIGAAKTVFDNGAFAILPAIVAKERLETANARLFSAQTVTFGFAGPPLGSFAFVLARALPFAGQALLLGIASLLLWRLPGDFQPRHATKGSLRTVLPDIAEGFRWYFGHRVIRALGIGIGVGNFAGMLGFAIYVLYARNVLGLDEHGYGLLLACGAIGGVLAGFLARPVAARLGGGTVFAGGQAISAAGFALLVLAPHPVMAGFVAAVTSFCMVTVNMVLISFRQSVIPDRLLGRVTSVFRLVAVGAGAIGAAASGIVADLFHLLAPFGVAALIFAVNAVWLGRVVTNRSLEIARAEVAEAA